MSSEPMLFPGLYRPREDDRALFEELGLSWLVQFGHGTWHDLGTWEHRDEEGKLWASVKVECCSMPAQFWRFTVSRGDVEDVQPMVIETGSGSLSDYWSTVAHAANGCLHVKVADV